MIRLIIKTILNIKLLNLFINLFPNKLIKFFRLIKLSSKLEEIQYNFTI